jgi:phosphoribosylamine--glycine ligase
MKLLVIGSGGREHAIAWKLAQSPKVQKVLRRSRQRRHGARERARERRASQRSPTSLRSRRRESILPDGGRPEAALAAGVVDAFAMPA